MTDPERPEQKALSETLIGNLWHAFGLLLIFVLAVWIHSSIDDAHDAIRPLGQAGIELGKVQGAGLDDGMRSLDRYKETYLGLSMSMGPIKLPSLALMVISGGMLAFTLRRSLRICKNLPGAETEE